MQKSIKNYRQSLALLAVFCPLLIFWVFWLFHPAYWFHTDPSAWYFLDSLAPFKGKPYAYVDHPGTPVHLIGTFLLGLTTPFFESREAFIHYHIAEPETFFVLANLFLMAMNLATVLVFYKTVLGAIKQDGLLAAGAISLMYFAIHPHGFNSLVYWSHNSFNFIFGTLWLLWLYHVLHQPLPVNRKTVFALGFFAGALGMTQLYMLSWLAGGFVSFVVFTARTGKTFQETLKIGLNYVAGGASGILLLLVPISGQIPRMLEWFARLIGSSGLYGAGEANLYSLNLIPLAIGFWAQYTPALLLALSISIIGTLTIAWLNKRNQLKVPPADLALLVGLFVQITILVLILSKFFYRIRYTLSLAAVIPIVFFIILKLLENTSWNLVALKRILYIGIVALALPIMIQDMQTQRQRDFVEKDAAQARSIAVTSLAQSRGIAKEEVVTVYGFGTPIKCAGLLLANNWMRAFDQELSALCPNQYALYDFSFEVSLNTPNPPPKIEDINWDLIVWTGSNTELRDYLESSNVRNIPGSWGVERSRWFFIRR
ncbi:MAG: hypothetical protein KGZ86_07425 [Candidatus Latescibacteria bacterium]|nr:hypothetical protein [Candidatus Latescibacterota bacterium]